MACVDATVSALLPPYCGWMRAGHSHCAEARGWCDSCHNSPIEPKAEEEQTGSYQSRGFSRSCPLSVRPSIRRSPTPSLPSILSRLSPSLPAFPAHIPSYPPSLPLPLPAPEPIWWQVENTEYARQVSHLEADKERLGLEVQLYCRLVDRAGGEIARQAADVQEELQVAVAQLEAARADLSGGSLYNASADLSEAPGASDAAMSDVTRTERKRIQSVVGDPGEAPLSCFDAPFAVLQRAMNAETCRREQEQGPGLLEIKDGAIYQLQMEQLTLNEAWAAQKKHLETTYRAEIHALEGQLATAQQQVTLSCPACVKDDCSTSQLHNALQ